MWYQGLVKKSSAKRNQLKNLTLKSADQCSDFSQLNSFPTSKPGSSLLSTDIPLFSVIRAENQPVQITPEDRLTVLCEITIDGKDTQQSGQSQVE